MDIKSKEDIADFITANLKELGGDAYGVDYVAEKLWEWHCKETGDTQGDRYKEKLSPDVDDDIYNIEEWEEAVNDGWITNYDGSGYWVKDGFKSRDEVFHTPKLDATHVIWYNK